MCPNAQENGEIRPSNAIRAGRGADGGPHLVSALREGRKGANICSSSGVIRGIPAKGTSKMKLRLIGAAFAISLLPVTANAQVTIDMSALTCDQYLAMSPSMSRDFSAWMSGWYSYQTRRRFVDVLAHQKNIESLKSWCQFRPQASVMNALQSLIGPQ